MDPTAIQPENFTVFDWMLVALLLYSTVRAAMRGFILEIFSLGGLIAGILLASWNYSTLAGRMVDWAGGMTALSYATAEIAAFLAIVIAVMVLCGITGKFLRSSVGVIGLGFVDRALGALFGLTRGCLLGVAAVMALAAFAPVAGPASRLTANSQLIPYFLDGAHGVSFVVPARLERQVADGAAAIERQLKHKNGAWIKPVD